MIPVAFDYASPSVLESGRDQALLGLAANRRRPVQFRGRLCRNAFLFRVALRALGEAIWSSDSWWGAGEILDPVITVHPDGLIFEAFSQDQSVYATLKVDLSLFDQVGEPRWGTTNIDFTAWLWAALAEIRTHRETWIRVESEGFEVQSVKAGGRFEKKVELPESWIRGFLHLQSAMAIPGTRIAARPVDLLSPIRYLRHTKSKVSPRALRYEFLPGQPVAIVLEPWELAFPLKGSEHSYAEPKVTRLWGRRRLRLLEPLLPFATGVEIHLKGRAMPSFYVVRMPGLTFTLGLSGWSENRWTEVDGFASLDGATSGTAEEMTPCLELFRSKLVLSLPEVTESLKISRERASRLLASLCRQGRSMFDLDAGKFRYRELLEAPIDEARVFPPSARFEKARALIQENAVRVTACETQEIRKIRTFKNPDGQKVAREIIHRDWHVTGNTGDSQPVEIVVKDNVRIIYGKCHCAFFRDHLLSQGPCAEMLALFLASQEQRRDLPVSSVATRPKAPPRPASEEAGGEGEAGGRFDGDEEEE